MTKFSVDWNTVLRAKEAVQNLKASIRGSHVVVLDQDFGCEALSREALAEKVNDAENGEAFRNAKDLYDHVLGLGGAYFDKEDDVFVVFAGDCGPCDASQKARIKAAVLRTRSRAVDIVDAALDDDTLRYRLRRTR